LTPDNWFARLDWQHQEAVVGMTGAYLYATDPVTGVFVKINRSGGDGFTITYEDPYRHVVLNDAQREAEYRIEAHSWDEPRRPKLLDSPNGS